MLASPTIHKTSFRGKSRRCHTRVPLDWAVRVLFGKNDCGKLIEMSEDGMSFEFSQPPALGQRIKFRFEPMGSIPSKYSPEILGDLQASGEAVWKRDLERTAGVHFVELREGSRERIRRWLALAATARHLALTDEIKFDAPIAQTEPLQPVPVSPDSPGNAVSSLPWPASQSIKVREEPLPDSESSTGPPPSWEHSNPLGSLAVSERISKQENIPEDELADSHSLQAPLSRARFPDQLTKCAEAWSVKVSQLLGEPTVLRGRAEQQEAGHGSRLSPWMNRATVVGASGCLAFLAGIVGVRTIRPYLHRRSAVVANATSPAAQLGEFARVESAAGVRGQPRFLVEVVEADGQKWQLWFVQNPPKDPPRQAVSTPAQSPIPSTHSTRGVGQQPTSSSRLEPTRNAASVAPGPDHAVPKDLAVSPPPVAAPPITGVLPSLPLSPRAAIGGTFASPKPSVSSTRAAPEASELKEARLLKSVSPAYPPFARYNGVSGDVTMDALIDASGNVTQVKATSGPGLLRDAAIAAVLQWKYEPARLNGKPLPTRLTVTLKFRIR